MTSLREKKKKQRLFEISGILGKAVCLSCKLLNFLIETLNDLGLTYGYLICI